MFSTNSEFKSIYVKPEADIKDPNYSMGIAVITHKEQIHNIKKEIYLLFQTFAKLVAADNEKIEINSLSIFNQTELDLINAFHQHLTETNNNIYNVFDFLEYSLTHSDFDVLVQNLNNASNIGVVYNFYPEVLNCQLPVVKTTGLKKVLVD